MSTCYGVATHRKTTSFPKIFQALKSAKQLEATVWATLFCFDRLSLLRSIPAASTTARRFPTSNTLCDVKREIPSRKGANFELLSTLAAGGSILPGDSREIWGQVWGQVHTARNSCPKHVQDVNNKPE
jgi:hypothetical protein